MADFRRWFLVFAALVLVLGSAVPASAQGPQVSCSVNTSVSPTLRAEGLTELVGDILLVCSPVPGHPLVTTGTVPTADITVSLSGTLSTSSVGTGLDALLLVDDPIPANQTVCTSPTNAAACPVAADGGQTFNQPGRYNVFQGILGGPSGPTQSITFLGVPVDPPASGSLTYRITNVRIQAPSVTKFNYGLTPVLAFVSSSSSTSITITQTTQAIVGYVSPGLIVSTSGTNPPLLQCQSYTDVKVGTLIFWEGFANAFKIQNTPGCGPTTTNNESTLGCQTQPGQIYYTESGLNVTIPGVGITGLANSPTQLEAVISDIPTGVAIWVDIYNQDLSGIAATLVSPTPIKTSGNQAEVLATGGSVTVVWAITASNPSAFSATTVGISSLQFNVYTTFTGAPGANGGSPQTSVTAYAQGGFYPQVTAWANGGPVPEFVTGLTPAAPGQSLFTVTLCQTILLFPYITDYVGFDTGIAISNTSLDTGALPTGLGASNQTGTCTVNFYGDSGVATSFGTNGAYTSPTPVAPGETWAFGLTPIDTTFGTSTFTGTTGYAIAVCNFQFAHGYTFVSDYGLRNFAAAYLALVIPDAPRSPNPFLCASFSGCGGQPGEQLVH